MFIQIFVAVVLIIILIVILVTTLNKNRTSNNNGEWNEIVDSTSAIHNQKICPLCKSLLKKGQTVQSHHFPGKPDGMMHIFGCPNCNSRSASRVKGIERVCPYCKITLDDDDFVVARVFQKPNKLQVHVLGCTRCRKVAKSN